MANGGMDGGADRDELIQRLELIETMIAEGRRSTTRCGWIFLLWGLVALTAMGWRFFQPHSNWVGARAWPVCLIAGAILTCIGLALQKRESGRSTNVNCLNVGTVWFMMGIALACYIASAMVRGLTWQYSYIAALLIIVGLAHAISAAILRWRVQGAMAAVWWLGGIAVFRARSQGDVQVIMFIEMCLSMIAFGIYTMLLERRQGGWGPNRAA
jgi:uncharacterized protein with PQ loop repeat